MSPNPSSEGPVVSSPSAGHRPLTSDIWRLGLPLAAFAVLWLDLIRQLSYVWSTNEQYAYGWFVPILAFGIFAKRWPTRPLATPERCEGESDFSVSAFQRFSFDFRFLLSAFCFLLYLSLLPLRLIHEVNQDWPLITWPLTAAVVALSLYAVYLKGGWPWVKHFAFPICFILVAVRWPYQIENGLTQSLMQLDATITVEIMGWLSIPAMQRGNLIELATGTVGVDEACSGIRSFQSTLMAALLMGELYRLRLWARAGLVGFGLLLAFGFNVVRTLILTWQANAHGLSAIEKWHDPAGLTIAIACFICLWALAVLIHKRWSVEEEAESRKQKAGIQVSGLILQPSGAPAASSPAVPAPVSHQSPVVSGPSGPRFLLSTFCFQLFLVAWVPFVIIATEVWYRSHEGTETGFVRWSVKLPETKPTFQTLEMPAKTRKLLSYDSGTAAKWQEEDGSEWNVYFFRWQGKSTQSIMAARYHRPEVCLPASGLQQVSDSQTDYFEAARLKLPFQKSSYSGQGQMLYVFYCLWQDGDERRKGMRSRNRADRLLGPIEGRRRFGQQVLEIITSGYASAAEAERALRQRLPGLIRVEGNAVPATSPSGHGSQ